MKRQTKSGISGRRDQAAYHATDRKGTDGRLPEIRRLLSVSSAVCRYQAYRPAGTLIRFNVLFLVPIRVSL
jgi:hypothetical protein